MDLKSLWPDGPLFSQPKDGFGFTTDSVLLADFACRQSFRRCCDLGSGIGVLTLLIADACPDALVEAVEIQPRWAELSRQNIAANGMEGRVNVITGDLREHRSMFVPGSFDLVVSNPPYFPAGSGKTAQGAFAIAREERCCTLADVVRAGAYLLKTGGRFCIVHRSERLAELMCAMTHAGLEPKRLRLIQHSRGSKPKLVLAEGRRGASPGLDVLPPLILKDDLGSDTPEARRIYHLEEN